MTPNTQTSPASSRTQWLRLYAAAAALPLALAACGGGGSGSANPASPTPSPAPAPAAGLAVSASASSTSPGGATVTLTATVTNSADTPTWTLSGPGSLSATSGTTVTYTPPDPATDDSTTTVTISAAISGSSQSVQIALTPVTVGTLQAVDYANARYVAVSDSGQALTSTDGSTWTTATVLTSTTATDKLDALAITHFDNTFIAAGSLSPSPYTTSTSAFATSADGVTWTPLTLSAITAPVNALVVGPQVLAIGASGTVFGSTDLATWTSRVTLSGPGALNAGVYANSHYWLVGNGGWIATSADGSSGWVSSKVVTDSSGTGVNLHGIAWNGTLFVAVGDNGVIATSADGHAWSTTGITAPLTGTLRGVAASTSGEFVVVGDDGIETSTDGVTFTQSAVTSSAALYGVGYLNGQFVAVGAGSTIKTFAN